MSDRKRPRNPYKRGNTWTFYYFVDGKKKTKGGYKTKPEAVAAKREIEAMVVRNEFIPTNAKCSDFLTIWLEDIKKPALAYHSYLTFRNCVKHMNAFFGKRKLQALDRTTVEKLYAHICSFSPSVAKNVKSCLSLALDYALEQKYVQTNIARAVELTKQPKKPKIVALTDEEIDRIIQASEGTVLYMPVVVSLALGVRKAEMWGLKFSDIDFKRKVIRIRRSLGNASLDKSSAEYELRKKNGSVSKAEIKTKTKSGFRPINMSDYVINEILAQKERIAEKKQLLGDAFHDQDFIICKKNGDPYSRDAHYKPYKRLLKKAGLPDYDWRSLRSTFASILNAGGISSIAISKAMGHATDEVTHKRYLDTTIAQTTAIDNATNYFLEFTDGTNNPGSENPDPKSNAICVG